jgi:carbon monoxide dehydrogenase subunit G
MRLDHEFTVPVPAAQAWPVLLDVDRIAPCMPGATITKVDGDDFEGTVKVKVGPITVTYGGTASFLEKDEAQRIAVIEARGKETRGSGTATARVTAQLFDSGEDSTRVAVTTDLSVTGKPAQFGRGVMSDVGNKLLGRFADCLAGELAGTSMAKPAPAPKGAEPASAESGVSAQSQAEAGSDNPDSAAATVSSPAVESRAPSRLDAPVREAEPIDLMEAAGGAVAKRVVPAMGVLALLAVLFVVLRRRR